MSVHPRNTQDLSLAPVAIELDTNLARFREKTPEEIAFELVLLFNCSEDVVDRGERARLLTEAVVKDVTMHGWSVAITDDAARLHLSGGSVTVDLGLSASVTDYLVHGASARVRD